MINRIQQNIHSGIDIGFPDTMFIGNGQSYFVKGWVYHPECEVKKVGFNIGRMYFPMDEIKQPRNDIHDRIGRKNIKPGKSRHFLFAGFSGCVDLQAGFTGKAVTIEIVAEFNNGTRHIIESKNIYFCTATEYYTPVAVKALSDTGRPLVAVCMATYNPDIRAFQRQIDSIKNQSYPNWICIINDDRSKEGIIDEIRSRIADDQRFHLFQNRNNLGFYHNFEQALRHIPNEAQLVAFCDQDDYWYPDKLHRLFERLSHDERIQLVYSDMKIVQGNGEVLSETYWRKRKNHYRNLDLVMMCGSVTGAASLFRKSLLKVAMPFPQNTGNAFHDHVVSCAALASGKIEYMDQPLYDYYQHERNVIGHHEFQSGYEQFLAYLKNKTPGISALKKRLFSFYTSYELNYLRLRIMSRSFMLRGVKPNKAFLLFNNRLSSMIRLLILHMKIKQQKNTTENAEIALAVSWAVRKYLRYLPVF